MSDSVRPHRRKPTRLPHPWDSPGKNTGVGCHFLLQCMKVKRESEVTQSCPTLSDPMDCSPPGSTTHGIFQARVLEWDAIAFSVMMTRTVLKQMLKGVLQGEMQGHQTITQSHMEKYIDTWAHIKASIIVKMVFNCTFGFLHDLRD